MSDAIKSLEKLNTEIDECFAFQNTYREEIAVLQIRANEEQSALRTLKVQYQDLGMMNISDLIITGTDGNQYAELHRVESCIRQFKESRASEEISLRFKIATCESVIINCTQTCDDLNTQILAMQRRSMRLLKRKPELVAQVKETLERLELQYAKYRPEGVSSQPGNTETSPTECPRPPGG